MKNILVPIDFSKAARNAARYAVSLAKIFDADVTFVNATPPAVIVDDSVLAFMMTTQAEILENNKRLIEKEVKALSKKYPAKITGIVKEGFATDIIQEMAQEKHADLIVMGMKGKGRSNSVFGSTTTTVIQKLSFPVLVVPEEAGYIPIQAITFASDFNPEIEINQYKLLLELVGKFNSPIQILNVQKKNSSLNPERAIGKMKTSLAFLKTGHQFHTINNRNVGEGIRKFVEKNPTDILVMVAHSHNLFERVFGKVHTKAMSYHTKIPLLVLQNK